MALDTTQLKALDAELMQYTSIKRNIRVREMELEEKAGFNPYELRRTSNNVSKPVESLAIKKGSDIILRNLYMFQDTIDEVLKMVDDDLKHIFKLRWIDKLTWEEIQDKIWLSKSTTYRKRNRILTLYAELRGYYNIVL